MEGVLDFHLRQLYSELGGIDGCTTEFIRINDSILSKRALSRTYGELLQGFNTQSGTPVTVQLLGSNPDALAANAATLAKLGTPRIDLNFGCPAKTVNKHRGGAILLDEPETIAKIISTIKQELPDDCFLSAKIRLGYGDRSRGLENALAIEAAGAQMLTVHARSKVDGYKPPAYWEMIAPIQQALKIPTVANGEIWTPADAQRCRDISGCQDIMIGRGLLARPDLGLQIKLGDQHQAWGWLQCLELVKSYFLITQDLYPEKFCGNRIKQWLMYLQQGYPEATQFFKQICRLKLRQEILDFFDLHLKHKSVQ